MVRAIKVVDYTQIFSNQKVKKIILCLRFYFRIKFYKNTLIDCERWHEYMSYELVYQYNKFDKKDI